MAISAFEVRGQMEAFTESLSGLTAKQRDQAPGPGFAERFNNLLSLAQEAASEVDPRLWPAPVEIRSTNIGTRVVRATYAEIETYARQVLKALPRDPLGVSVKRV